MTRTQVYLTKEQRRKLDSRMSREGKALAVLIRDALDRYLTEPEPELEDVLAATFGSLPNLQVPDRSDWDRA